MLVRKIALQHYKQWLRHCLPLCQNWNKLQK